MRRIQLGKPYENFLDKMIESGYYSTATEVIRDALRDKMAEMENNRIAAIHALIAEGQADIDAGKVHKVDEDYIENLLKRGIDAAKRGDSVPNHVRP